MQGFLRDTSVPDLLAEAEPGKVVVLFWNDAQPKYWREESRKKHVINLPNYFRFWMTESSGGRFRTRVAAQALCQTTFWTLWGTQKAARDGRSLPIPAPSRYCPSWEQNLLWKCQCVRVEEEEEGHSKAEIAACSTDTSQTIYISCGGRRWCVYFTESNFRTWLTEIQQNVLPQCFLPACLLRGGNFSPSGCVCIYFNCKYPLCVDSCWCQRRSLNYLR